MALTPGTRLGVYEVIAQIGAGGMGVDAGVLHVPGILDLPKFGLRVIIPDQPGHGQSDRGSQSEYSHRTWALDAHKLVGGLGLCHGLHYSATGEPQALAGSRIQLVVASNMLNSHKGNDDANYSSGSRGFLGASGPRLDTGRVGPSPDTGGGD